MRLDGRAPHGHYMYGCVRAASNYHIGAWLWRWWWYISLAAWVNCGSQASDMSATVGYRPWVYRFLVLVCFSSTPHRLGRQLYENLVTRHTHTRTKLELSPYLSSTSTLLKQTYASRVINRELRRSNHINIIVSSQAMLELESRPRSSIY